MIFVFNSKSFFKCKVNNFGLSFIAKYLKLAPYKIFTVIISFKIILKWSLAFNESYKRNGAHDLNNLQMSILNMVISKILLKYFNRNDSKSTDKNHTRYRNDICNHWDLDYLSAEEIEKILLKKNKLNTTIPRKKKDEN